MGSCPAHPGGSHTGTDRACSPPQVRRTGRNSRCSRDPSTACPGCARAHQTRAIVPCRAWCHPSHSTAARGRGRLGQYEAPR
eukprot:UN4021